MNPKSAVPTVIKILGFDTRSAQQWARKGRIEAWVHRYLTSGSWANPDFSRGLELGKRWWRGPILVELKTLTRSVGPEAGMEYEVDPETWLERTTTMAQSLEDPLEIPPLIIEYRSGELSVRDGNSRYGAMELKGWSVCWVIIWYNSAEDFLQHGNQLAA